MGKFSGASAVKKAQEGRLGEVELPTEGEQLAVQSQPEEAPASPPSRLVQRMAQAAPEEEVQAAEEAAAVDETAEAEIERQRVPSLRERGQGGERVDRWLRPPTPPIPQEQLRAPAAAQASGSTSDGNLRSRMKVMGDALKGGALTLTAKGTAGRAIEKEGAQGAELAEAIATTSPGSLLSALSRSNAVTYDPETDLHVADPLYGMVSSAVVENEFANVLLGQTKAEPLDFQTDEEKAAGVEADIEEGVGPQGAQQLTHASGNRRLGQTIHQEYQRMQGVKVPDKLPEKEAETLGAAMKHLWADQNRKLVKRNIDPKTNQYVYELTAEGESNLKDGEEDRKRLFPKVNVRPAKQPLVRGQLPGDVGATQVKKIAGTVVGDPSFDRTLKESMTNLGTVPNVVDKQRAKIMLSVMLPVLKGGDHTTWQAEVSHMGQSKIDKYKSEAFLQNSEEHVAYDPEEQLANLIDKNAQELRSVIQERNGANYLSYNLQGFQGRITPQQSFFNPTTSKIVRFTTRNAVPAIIKRGNQADQNIRQMYAMMLLPKPPSEAEGVAGIAGDVALPHLRDQKLDAQSNQLEAWGDRLSEALTMTDEQYEAVSAAIEQGMALTDPNFPQFPGLELDQERDADLITHLDKKGEDGMAVIDGLIDYSKYVKARREGKPFHSYFNAYIDGKTNGIASNGMQTGDIRTAERTGVIRSNHDQLLDEGDIRDELKTLALQSIEQGWGGLTEGFESEMNEVASEVFSDRNLNKATTMTFGYGKEIDSFGTKIKQSIALRQQELGQDSSYSRSLKTVLENMERLDPGKDPMNVLSKSLNEKYQISLRDVMSEEAINNRLLMRSASALHAATNNLFSITSPTGTSLDLGRNLPTGYDKAAKTIYRLGGEKEKVAHYETEGTAAAPKASEGEGGEIELTPGEFAYGGSVVAPVQAMDAATVGLTASGKSWNRLKQASGGNPYLHTIYDAFKMDANGYHVVLEEVNQNWMDVGMDWSYLEQTYNQTKKTMAEFRENVRSRLKDGPVTLTKNESMYMDWFLKGSVSKTGSYFMGNFLNKMQKFKDYGDNEKAMWDDHNIMKDQMAKVGYDIRNPPEAPTIAQLDRFVDVLNKQLGLASRMQSAINRNKKAKGELRQEIQKRGYKTPSGKVIPLQYYSH